MGLSVRRQTEAVFGIGRRAALVVFQFVQDGLGVRDNILITSGLVQHDDSSLAGYNAGVHAVYAGVSLIQGANNLFQFDHPFFPASHAGHGGTNFGLHAQRFGFHTLVVAQLGPFYGIAEPFFVIFVFAAGIQHHVQHIVAIDGGSLVHHLRGIMIKQFLAKGNGLVPLQPFQRVGVNLGPDKLSPERRDISYRKGGIYDGQGFLGLGAVNLQGSPGGVQGVGGLGEVCRGLEGPAATYYCQDSAIKYENLFKHVVRLY